MGLEVEDGSIDRYRDLLDLLSTAELSGNLSGEEGFRMINGLIDIDNLCDYYIAELYFANGDFPHNNYKMYREKTEDGKWNWLFYDCDGCMIRTHYDHISEYFNPAINEKPVPGTDPASGASTDPTYGSPQGSSSGYRSGRIHEPSALEFHESWTLEVFRQVLQNDLFRDYFYARMLYHINHTFSPGNVISEIDRFEEIYRPLVAEHIFRWNQPNEVNKWSHNVSMMRTFAIQRPPELLEQFQKNLGNPIEIRPNPSSGRIRIAHPFSSEIGIRIFSLSGSTVYSDVRYGSADRELNIDTRLSPGMYILRLEGPSLSFSEKLIIR
jgi:hypothetical protein